MDENKINGDIAITRKEYDRLKDADAFLGALFAAGVDSWEGFEAAQGLLEDED